MKRRLLLGAMLLGSFFTMEAQTGFSCDEPIELTGTGTTTYTVDGISGSLPTAGGCWATMGTAANWYIYPATENALIRINSNLEVNAGGDTRISVYTGDCSALTCVDGIDDVDDNNYLSDLTIQAVAGTVYYFTFDDRWEADGFDFEVTITPTSCFSPTGFTYADAPTFTTVSLTWDDPATGIPEGYEVEYGVDGFDQGTGTSLELSEALAQLEGLTSGTDYDFYIRTNCGNGDYSEWAGPINFTTPFEPTNLNYAYGFETANLNGFTPLRSTAGANGALWAQSAGFTTTTTPAVTFTPQEGDLALIAGNYGAASDCYAISRGINVEAGQVVTVSFWVRKIALEGSGGGNVNFGVYAGTAQTVAAQTIAIRTVGIVPPAASTAWTQVTYTYTFANAGVYYFSIRYRADAQTQTNRGYLAIDNFTLTSPTAGFDNADLKEFSVFPNPATNVVTVANANALVSSLTVADLNGRTVKTAKFDGVSEATVNVSDLASGVYMLTIASDKGTTTRKIVKN
ncbi:T9SS type A sorting domain-containing protein [Flavobacterium sp. Sd200]|uniref:T9SS-dependent choice-of-anchor J family protein n=1 Tax=Flavobacterium sp. Sd200 TaxID=2692211 RepID=UPI001370D8AA|nr:T9SS type A sorting domain-containing protein [Flavobacterium sp. Sd200]MXN92421.1 T9SS type A sorting domain-containing protein [Flavobacterium sp. Sd200]